MAKENEHGLPRHIPADVARAVRQECGFGCVICGVALIQYEHFDPEFAEAREHVASAPPCCVAAATTERRAAASPRKPLPPHARNRGRCRTASFATRWNSVQIG